MKATRCALCLKALPQRQTKIRTIDMPYNINGMVSHAKHYAHKNCAGVYKQYTNRLDLEHKQKKEFEIIKARIAKAAGHKVAPDLKFWKPDTHDDQVNVICGRSASLLVIDDIEPQITYDKTMLMNHWIKSTDNALKGALNGTNIIS